MTTKKIRRHPISPMEYNIIFTALKYNTAVKYSFLKYALYLISIFLYFIALYIINRGILLFWGEYLIYFIKCIEKIIFFSGKCSTSENVDIFTTQDEKYLVFAQKVFLSYTQRKIKTHNLTFSMSVSHLI